VIGPDEVAGELLLAERERKEIAPFSDAHPGFDLAAGYAAQRLVVRARTDAGERVAGARLARTDRASLADRQQAGGSEPVYGLVTTGMFVSYPARLDPGALIAPQVQPHLAFLLGTELRGPVTVPQVLAATEAVFGALDVSDSRYAGAYHTPADLVADNCGAGRLLLGPEGGRPADLVDLRLVGCVLRVDGDVVHTAAGAAALGHPAAAVAWLAGRLAEQGEPLPAGWLVFSGGLTPPVPLRPGHSVTAEFDGLGSVETFL
jgi:2-oxo-3-hexenedioate decarboxylase